MSAAAPATRSAPRSRSRAPGGLPVAVCGDGDFMMANTAVWTAAHYKIPLLIVVANNRSFFNDELHQERVARIRARPPENRWIGQRISPPDIDIAALARSQGAQGFGPVTKQDDLVRDLREGDRRGRSRQRRGGRCAGRARLFGGGDRSHAARNGKTVSETGSALMIHTRRVVFALAAAAVFAATGQASADDQVKLTDRPARQLGHRDQPSRDQGRHLQEIWARARHALHVGVGRDAAAGDLRQRRPRSRGWHARARCRPFRRAHRCGSSAPRRPAPPTTGSSRPRRRSRR